MFQVGNIKAANGVAEFYKWKRKERKRSSCKFRAMRLTLIFLLFPDTNVYYNVLPAGCNVAAFSHGFKPGLSVTILSENGEAEAAAVLLVNLPVNGKPEIFIYYFLQKHSFSLRSLQFSLAYAD